MATCLENIYLIYCNSMTRKKKYNSDDDVRHYKVKYEKQHAGQPQNRMLRKSTEYVRKMNIHIKMVPTNQNGFI